MFKTTCLLILIFIACSCKKNGDNHPIQPSPVSFAFTALKIDGAMRGLNYFNASTTPVLKFTFSDRLLQASVINSLSFKDPAGAPVACKITFENHDSTLVVVPASRLSYITHYSVDISTALRSASGGGLLSPISQVITTVIDSSDKFPALTDQELLTTIQRQTFRYFGDFGHPVSGMARERNTSGDIVTTGGTGFGVMAIIVAIERNFITKAEGLERIARIVNFLKNNCTSYHGAFAHWINGANGVTVPFGPKDDGADLVETSYLMQGLLCARQYFDSAAETEKRLREDINLLWNRIDWNWFRLQSTQDVLFWHWSPVYQWEMNFPIRGWNEALIVYVLAASSPGSAITRPVYENGWADKGRIKNGQSWFDIFLPLGPAFGGPLFFAHYSFLGINPHDLSDAYANYMTQNIAHTKINYAWCVKNPSNYNGYSSQCWGLTASDNNINGYAAHAPGNDLGVISPTAAVSSLPYSPTESLNAMRFFYFKLGDKIWGTYGFTDAFNLTKIWFADTYLAIDQGPQIVMIENYRTGLLWRLFMSCPEIKTGMKNLGFQSPNL